MRKQKEDNSFLKINRINPVTNAVFSVVMSVIAVLTVVPVVLVLIISVTSSESLTLRGFSFFPISTSFVAYNSLFKTGSQLVDSYMITIVVTLIHTVVSVLIMTMYAYVLAQQRFSGRRFYTFIVFFTMLFSGGLVPSYIINVNVLHLYDTFWILVLACRCSPARSVRYMRLPAFPALPCLRSRRRGLCSFRGIRKNTASPLGARSKAPCRRNPPKGGLCTSDRPASAG